MHTNKYGTVTVHSNPDLSGDVIINIPQKTTPGTVKEVEVPGWVLLRIVANYVRDHKISQLEQADTLDLLGVPEQP